MQAYSTLRNVESLGFNAELIDYRYPNKLHSHTTLSIKNSIKHCLGCFAKMLLPGDPYHTLNRRWDNAFLNYYKLSQKYPTRESLFDDPPVYDIYLVGSDQVWNEAFINHDDSFFAAFSPKHAKKIAFGSSFGSLSVSDIDFYREQLMTFQSIAIRESSGVDLAKRITGRNDIKKVTDPSLMITADEWQKMLHAPNKGKKDYIFCYGSNAEEYMLHVAKSIAEKNDLDIYRCNGSALDYFNKDVHYILDAGPLEWLGLINNAALIIACSFHGTAFSLQFNKPFLSIFTGKEQTDSRVSNLLDEYNLRQNSLTVGNNNIPSLNSISDIDWKSVNNILSVNRQNSLDTLKKC